MPMIKTKPALPELYTEWPITEILKLVERQDPNGYQRLYHVFKMNSFLLNPGKQPAPGTFLDIRQLAAEYEGIVASAAKRLYNCFERCEYMSRRFGRPLTDLSHLPKEAIDYAARLSVLLEEKRKLEKMVSAGTVKEAVKHQHSKIGATMRQWGDGKISEVDGMPVDRDTQVIIETGQPVQEYLQEVKKEQEDARQKRNRAA